MSDRSISTRDTAKVIAASGRLRNEHFLLTADHLLLEVDPASFELVSAMAEGNIQVHMAVPEPYGEYVILARSAVFQPYYQRLNLNGPIGTRVNGVECAPVTVVGEVRVPTDGTFVLPPSPEEAEQGRPSRISRFKKRLGTRWIGRRSKQPVEAEDNNFLKCIIASAWKTL